MNMRIGWLLQVLLLTILLTLSAAAATVDAATVDGVRIDGAGIDAGHNHQHQPGTIPLPYRLYLPSIAAFETVDPFAVLDLRDLAVPVALEGRAETTQVYFSIHNRAEQRIVVSRPTCAAGWVDIYLLILDEQRSLRSSVPVIVPDCALEAGASIKLVTEIDVADIAAGSTALIAEYVQIPGEPESLINSSAANLQKLRRSEHWSVQPSGISENLTAVHFVNATTGWAVGDNGVILHTGNGGERWTQQYQEDERYLVDVYFATEEIGWVLGQWPLHRDDDLNQLAYVLATEDGGNSWHELASPRGLLLRDLVFPELTTGWMAGDIVPDHVVLRTEDGGASWRRFPIPQLGPLAAVDGDHAWVAPILQGHVRRTVDGGESWSVWPLPHGPYVTDMAFITTQQGWAMGHVRRVDGAINTVLLETVDGGITWSSAVWTCAASRVMSMVNDAGDHRLNTYGLLIIDGCDPNTQIIVSVSRDGYFWEEWYALPEPQDVRLDPLIRDVSLVDRNTGWAVGADGLILKYSR